MKWVCLMANMLIPGMGSLIIKRWGPGLIQTVLSLLAWGVIIPALALGWSVIKQLIQGYNQAVGEEFDAVGSQAEKIGNLVMDNIPLLVIAVLGVILLKITLIWSGFTVVRHFKSQGNVDAENQTSDGPTEAADAETLLRDSSN